MPVFMSARFGTSEKDTSLFICQSKVFIGRKKACVVAMNKEWKGIACLFVFGKIYAFCTCQRQEVDKLVRFTGFLKILWCEWNCAT